MSNICIFSAQYLPHLGGVERYTYNLAKHLNQRGDHVVIVTSNVQKLASYEVIDGVEVYRIPSLNLMDGRYPVLKLNKEFFKIHRILMRMRFDLVLVNTRFYPHSVYGTVFAKKQKARCIMVEHGTSHMTVHNPIGDFAEQMIEHFLTVIDKLNCKEFYGVSEACCEWMEHFHIKAKGTLYNSVDLQKIEEMKQRKLTDFREKYRISEQSTVVTFTGRLLKEKGIHQLTEAVSRLRRDGMDVVLFIAGDGDEEQALRKKVKDGIFLLGRLDFKEIISLLEQTDIFCLPSDSEGFSTSVLEAAACNCYIVTTERGGTKEMITDQRYGMIIKQNDTKTITEALRKIIPEKAYREKAAKATYQRLKENYTWDIVAEKVHELAGKQRT